MRQADFRILKSCVNRPKLVRISTNHPDKDRYAGVVLGASDQITVLREERDLRLDGVVILPNDRISRVEIQRSSSLHYRLIMAASSAKSASIPAWVKGLTSIQEALAECRQRGIWPVIETIWRGGSPLYLGPITTLGANAFRIYCYGSDGRWERNFELDYRDVFRITFFDTYSTIFNRHMSRQIPNRVQRQLICLHDKKHARKIAA